MHLVSSTTLLVAILGAIFTTMMEKTTLKSTLKTSFECGFNPINQKKMTFSTNFLLIAMLFLIFDIEITFLIPMAMAKNFLWSWNFNSVCMFLIVLTILVKKEWKQGSMEWSK